MYALCACNVSFGQHTTTRCNTLQAQIHSHNICNHLLHLVAHSVLVKRAALKVGYSQLGRGRQLSQRRELHQPRLAVEPRQILKEKLRGTR